MEEKHISVKRVVLTSFFVDFIDVVLSLGVAILSGSVIMLTQVFEGIADLVSSGLLLVGMMRASRAEDKTHPFGYGKELYFWTLLAALVMFGVTATLSIYLGWQRFLKPEAIHNIVLAYAVLVLTLCTNGYAFLLSFRRLVKKRGFAQVIRIFYTSSLVETKTTFVLDLMGTIASLLGLVGLGFYSVTGNLRFDGLGAVVIGLVLAFLAYLLVLGVRDLLIGRSAQPEVLLKIRRAALEIPEVKEVLELKTMHIGTEKLHVDLDVNMQGRLTTREIEKLIDMIQANIVREVPSVKHVQVELETRS